MSKYNPRNPHHRHWLAQNLLSVLEKWGFQITTAGSYANAWEFVLERVNKYDPNKVIIIYTSIDKKSGAMRQCGTDRIRILHKSRLTNHHRRISRINRTGEFKNIQQRVITGIKTAQGL